MELESKLESKFSMVHVIYEDGTFRKDLGASIQKWALSGFDFNSVAILGPQSSGKSTLLNGLFGTSFPTMHGEEGRYQCTKGIWLGKSARSPILVMDVEGTDGRERGEAEVAFEKKTSLFSLALAEVLIVNMWMQDIGRNNAANLPLLKTVLEINLQLFQHEKRSKTLLLFVVRDHVRQATPLEKLQVIIEKDLRDIWSGINKPEKFKNSLATDFFEFQFVSLPHKVLESDKFTQELAGLGERFNDRKNAKYIWSKSVKSSIPADGFAMFAQKIWETILENKDLDLPSQREILATFRCDEIAAEALSKFEQAAKSVKEAVREKKIVEDFGSQCDLLMDSALISYAETATHYLPEIVEKKREALNLSMLKELKDVWNTLLSLMLEHAGREFESALQSSLRASSKDQTTDFGLTVRGLKKQHSARFAETVRATIPKRADWSFGLAEDQLNSAMDAAVSHEREKQLKLVADDAQALVVSFGEQIDDILELARPKMWSEIRRLFQDGESDGKLSELRGRLETLNVSPEDVRDKMAEISEKKLQLTRKRFEQHSERVLIRMEKAFDSVFRVDSATSLPRVWKPDTELQSIFREASVAGKKILELFTLLRLDPADDDVKVLDEETKVAPEKLLMSKSRANAILSQFEIFASAACADAQRAMEQYGKASSVPTYMVLLIILLGWNEFMYIISNPFALILLITVASAAYAIHVMGMAPVIFPVVVAAYNQIQTMVSAAIAQYVNPQPAVAHAVAADKKVRPKKD